MYLDLHVHLRGTIHPMDAARLADKHGKPIHHLIQSSDKYSWNDFTSFLRTYDEIASLIVTAADLEAVAYDYLSFCAAQGTAYVEFMLSPPDLLRVGVSWSDQLAALEAAWRRSRREFGIESRMIATGVRHLGPDAVLNAAEIVVAEAHPYVVGFGLTGDERQFDVAQFAPAFELARKGGLKLTAHAGEHREAKTICDAVEALNLDRVGHGVRSVESRSTIDFLLKKEVGLEVCLSSNLALGLFKDLSSHPFKTLYDAGIKVSLGTDDPGFFATSPRREHCLAKANAGFSDDDLKAFSLQAIDLAFCDDETKIQLREKFISSKRNET